MVLLITNVTIPSDYEYIRGTVNDIDTVFVADMVITGLCLCNCDPAPDGSYEVSLTFFDEADEELSTVTKTVIQDNIRFIYDRTAADIEYLKRLTPAQRARLVSDHKGALNLSDLQRMAAAFGALEVLDDIVLAIESIPEFPDDILFQSYLDNAEDIKGTDYQLTSSPEVPALPLNDFDKWNKLEQILFDNFDIRTTRFKYFNTPIREGYNPYPFIYEYLGAVYVAVISSYANIPVTILNGKTATGALLEIQDMLGYEVSTLVRTVDGGNVIRTVDGTNIIRRVE